MLGIPGGIEFVLMLVLFLVVPVMLFWRILRRAGLPAPLALIAVFPGPGQLALLCVLASADCPAADDDEPRAQTP